MEEFIIHTIIWTLALYGLFEIIKEIVYMYVYTKFKSDGTYLIVVAKNQEEYIENFLRTLFKIIYGKEENLKNIFVADLNSVDNTREIIKRLSRENEYFNYISWKECKDIIDNINEK